MACNGAIDARCDVVANVRHLDVAAHRRGRCHASAVQELDIDGQRFVYEIIGDGRPVVPVRNVAQSAGWPTDSDIAALRDAGCSLVSYRHLGTTDTIIGIAADVGRFLDRIDIGPVALWGYSQGAMAAQELALLRPDLVACAALVTTRGRLTSYDRLRYAVEAAAGTSDAGVLLQLMMTQAPDALADDALVDAIVAASRTEPADEQQRLIERAGRAGATYGDRLDALREVAVPCLVVAFSHDVNIPPTLNREVADAIPACEYAEVHGAGHAGGITHRREVRDLVVPFLSRPRP
jgi:pimeloyl-ACP methyl ester carboxylesterase